MVKPTTRYTRATSFAILVISLVAMGAMLAGMLVWLLHAAGLVEAKSEKQQYFLRLASVTMAALLLWVVILVGLVARYIARRLTDRTDRPQPMGYVDAWAEAGRRLDPKDAPPVDGFEIDLPEEPEGNGT
ncbi:hypothetical protein LCGC14_1636950 [marine sediment metagenome]|uniref:Uncharacterized protein n=1 Tax=marine sediment metagenome TaxID=412755 RepID=A0A0F9IN85_9ZZZZ